MAALIARRVAIALVALPGLANLSAAETAAPGTEDPASIFRFDPLRNEMVSVPSVEIKAGFTYSRFHPGLNRRVWSVAVEGGGFEYAMAPGSVQLARSLDLRATPQELREALDARAPELARIMDVRGAVAHMRLTPDDAWELIRQPTIASVFDLETNRRWEWHGQRRVAIMHTGGYEWALLNGEFVPVTAYQAFSGAACW